jgi:NAD(P)-dependent dehydrogenase (short-subunit alcohol dehydrogenase family)
LTADVDGSEEMAGDSNRMRRVWFVTGAASGFGRAMVSAALERGDQVVATDKDERGLTALRGASDDQLLTARLDITESGAVREVVDDAVGRFGRLDVVFNCAGMAGSVGAVEEVDDADLRKVLETDLFGVINVTRAALPHMRRQRSGRFLQMSSLNGVEGLPGGAYYAAAKFGVEGFSESLAEEVAHLGVKVTIVEPGPHRTRFLDETNVSWAREIADYADSVGQTREQLRALDGQQPGDPERAAQAMIHVVESEDPPRRLPLGGMALEHIRARLRAQLDELEEWATVSATSDFPGQGAA